MTGVQTCALPILNIDGLRVPVPVPPLAGQILRLIDGKHSVGEIGALLAAHIKPDTFARAWATLFPALERINRLLLAAPD